MALLFMDGFDHYDPQVLDGDGNKLLARGKASYLTRDALRIAGRRAASYALRLPVGPEGGYVKNLAATITRMYVGCAVRVPTSGNTNSPEPLLMGVRDSSTNVSHLLKLGGDGRVYLYRRYFSTDTLLASSIATVARGVWNYLELYVYCASSGGVIQVRVNGVLDIDLSSQNTKQSQGDLLTAFLAARPGTACDAAVEVDDLYILDNSDTLNNTFLGDVRVDLLAPNAAGSNNAMTVTGAATAWEALSDSDEATYVQSTATAQKTTVGHSNLPSMTSPTVYGVQVVALARKTDAGSASLKGIAYSGSSTGAGATVVLTEQAQYQTGMINKNPNGSVQWTESTVNAAEFGVESA